MGLLCSVHLRSPPLQWLGCPTLYISPLLLLTWLLPDTLFCDYCFRFSMFWLSGQDALTCTFHLVNIFWSFRTQFCTHGLWETILDTSDGGTPGTWTWSSLCFFSDHGPGVRCFLVWLIVQCLCLPEISMWVTQGPWSLLYVQCLPQCLAYSRCSMNAQRINEPFSQAVANDLISCSSWPSSPLISTPMVSSLNEMPMKVAM